MKEAHRQFWFGVATIVVGYLIVEFVLKPVAAGASPTAPAGGVFVPGGATKPPAGGATGAWLR